MMVPAGAVAFFAMVPWAALVVNQVMVNLLFQRVIDARCSLFVLHLQCAGYKAGPFRASF